MSEVGYAKAVAPSGGNMGPATVHGAIGVASDVHNRLLEAAVFAEKVAEALDGPSPSDASTTRPDTPGPASMADHLTRTVDGLHAPTSRIFHALERIQRRLG